MDNILNTWKDYMKNNEAHNEGEGRVDGNVRSMGCGAGGRACCGNYDVINSAR